MKKRVKASFVACIISAVALVIAAVNCALYGMPVWRAVTVFCAMIAVLCANLSIYSKRKKDVK